MPHILTGTWKSFIVRNGNPIPDDDFDLKITESNGHIEPGSKHGTADITGGGASPGASQRHHIQLETTTPASKFKGFLLVNGPQLIMVGVANLHPEALVGEGETLFDQEQEIWIAHKP